MSSPGTTPTARTADELWLLPDDGYRYELVRGELRRSMPAGHRHGEQAMRIGESLSRFARQHGLGRVYAAETGFRLDANHVRAPDVAFVCTARVEEAGAADGFWPGPPDLAVEVVSPGDRYTDVEEKVFDWLDAGARMVVVVNDRRRTVTVVRSGTDVTVLTEGQTLQGDDVVPGWELPLADIFG